MIRNTLLLICGIASVQLYQFDNLKVATKPTILPQPHTVTSGASTSYLDACNLQLQLPGSLAYKDASNDQIKSNINKFMNEKIFLNGDGCNKRVIKKNGDTVISQMIVNLNDQNEKSIPSDLSATDESYNITISADTITIDAKQYSGVMRAVSTLAYLVKDSSENGQYLYEVPHLPIQIQDSPRYLYRGLMLDTSRRFYHTSTIKQILDVMALAKMNVFHWHIVDDDSFPMTLDSYPNVTYNGAFHSDMVYSKQDMIDVINYATALAIRVVPEFDNPGHVRAVGLDPEFAEVVRCLNKDWASTVPGAYKVNGGPPTGVLDPSYNKTFDFLRGIFTDMNSVFTDNMIHLGGDEVLTSCFNENPNIQAFMKAQGLSSFDDLIVYHQGKAREILTEINPDKVGLYWSNEDTFYQKYKKDDVLVYWGTSDKIAEMAKTYPDQKYVFAPGDYYYLDCGHGNKYGSKSWCDPFHTFWGIYSFEPTQFLTSDNILGGEVAAWSEMFGDLNIHTRIWSRASAMSDKLWGPLVDTDLVGIAQRQIALSEKINSMGIPSSPITGVWCEVNSDHCFAKHQQTTYKPTLFN